MFINSIQCTYHCLFDLVVDGKRSAGTDNTKHSCNHCISNAFNKITSTVALVGDVKPGTRAPLIMCHNALVHFRAKICPSAKWDFSVKLGWLENGYLCPFLVFLWSLISVVVQVNLVLWFVIRIHWYVCAHKHTNYKLHTNLQVSVCSMSSWLTSRHTDTHTNTVTSLYDKLR